MLGCRKLQIMQLIYTKLNCVFALRILLEADPNAVVQKVALRNEDIPLGEQTVAQVRTALSLHHSSVLCCC